MTPSRSNPAAARNEKTPQRGHRAGFKSKVCKHMHTTVQLRGKDNPPLLPLPLRPMSPVEAYALRQLAARSRISTAHAAVVAELCGIIRGDRHHG